MGNQSKLNYALHIRKHLRELSILARREISASELIQGDAITELQERSRSITKSGRRRWNMPFAEKDGARFRQFVEALADLYSGPVHVWTHLTRVCGLLALPSIRAFNFGFEFEIDPNEVIALTSVDCRDKLLMDYTMEGSEQILEVEVLGERWIQAQY